MRYAIISDIHSNLQAFKAALECIEKDNVDEIICLGDIVGYNANPAECIEIVQKHPKIKHIVVGNHDDAAVRYDKIGYSEWLEWSDDARDGLEYSNSVLSVNHLEWLKSYPEKSTINDPNIDFLISHCHPCGKSINYGYVLSDYDAKDVLDFMRLNIDLKSRKIRLAFFGHSHLPTVAFRKDKGDVYFNMGSCACEVPIEIKKGYYYLINPGAIGQPRKTGFTTYAIFDSDKMVVNIKPFEYDIKVAQEAILNAKYANAGINRRIAKRLGV